MSFQSILTDPASLRTALFCLAGALVLVAFIIRKIREKRNPEPKVIRLTLASDMPPVQVREGPSDPAVAQVSPPPQTLEVSSPPEAARLSSAAQAFEIPPPPEEAQAAPPVSVHAISPPAYASETSQATDTLHTLQPPEGFPPAAGEEAPAAAMHPAAYSLLALQERSPMILDILRGALIMLAILVAAALLLVLMPQSGVDRMAAALRPRNAPGPPPEKIAFLYLGDEIKDNQFHIRGVVKNITEKPIEQLDATIRLYAPDRTLLETAVVRMDSDIIFPDATASFHLSYPDYHGQFGSYSLDFKLRQGDPILYKDMREARATS
jgi:hypothetical protein